MAAPKSFKSTDRLLMSYSEDPSFDPPRRSRRVGKLVSLLNVLILCAILQYVWGYYIRPVFSEEDDDALKFTPCGSIECTTLEAPLDYSDPDGDKVHLAVARYPASNQKERIGTLLMNPGGPGGSGVDLIEAIGRTVDSILEGRYDLVSWDPRGMGRSTPRFSCFESSPEAGIFTANSAAEIATEWRNLSDPVDLTVWSKRLREVESKNKVLSELCFRQSEKIMQHMGTPDVARDMDTLYRALEGDETLVNYWGFSYGTILGSYFVNMFPDRVGRMIIDGVVDPVMWSSEPVEKWNRVLYTDTEQTLENFITQCVEAGPKRCAFASQGSDASALMAKLDAFLLELYDSPLPVPDAERPGILTSGMVKLHIFRSLYTPRGWPVLAEALNSAMNGNGTAIVNRLQSPINLNASQASQPNDSAPTWAAVGCIDSPAFEPSEDAFAFTVKESVYITQEVSRHFGADGSAIPANVCAFWKARTSERFTGPWNRKLKNEILVIGNTGDPVTPVVNARAVNERMPHSSRLVIQEGDGHCSIAQTSLCTMKTVLEYLVNGTLPENGRLCKVEELAFPHVDGTVYDLGGENVSAHDLKLLDTIREAGFQFYL